MTTTEITVHNYFLLDRTGSMERVVDDVIGGFNAFVAEQQALPGRCRFTLVQFDHVDPFEVVHDAVKIAEVPPLTSEAFIPRGLTPLIDAECRLIAMIEEREAKRAAAGKKPESIVVITYTDGLENRSEEYTFEQLKALKKKHEQDWAFIYLGVGHDGYAQASQAGTQVVNTRSATLDSAGVHDTYAAASTEVTHARERASKGLRTNSAQTRAAETQVDPSP